MNRMALTFFLCGTIMLACTTRPEQINYGKDQCAFCKMTIAELKFGAELVTDKGRIFKYDAIECLLRHIHDDALSYQNLLVVGYDTPKQLHPIDSLIFVNSPNYKSPMGANLAAFFHKNALPESERSKVLEWTDLMNKFKTD
ncbi:MAG: copper-binding protein [Flavobacteriales bacterium]|nr:copper-binding protein [Flavobacteriales bacterium]